MKRAFILTALLAGAVFVTEPVLADQRPRNPGGGGSSSGGGSGTSGGSSGGDTGRVAVPRGGGSSPWGGGGSSRPSEPSSTSSSGGRRPARVSGGSGGTGVATPPPYSRARGGAPVTGYAVPRGSVGTLPPIISGPIYWGPDSWYFYPWGYGGLALGYLWDPWMWNGYYGGMGGYGYPWVDPYYYGGGGGGWGSDAASTAGTGQSAQTGDVPNPLDPNAQTGALRLKVVPREAEVLVDGYFAGRVDDFDGAMQKLKVAVGPHRVEIRAPGYEPLSFDVMIVEGQTTTYKADLKRN